MLAFVALLGILVANNRVSRGFAEVVGEAFDYANGDDTNGVGLRVRVTVRSTGLGKLRLGDAHPPPTISVQAVVLLAGETESYESPWEKKLLEDEVLDPGEMATVTVPFLLGAPPRELVGWAITFNFVVKRRWPRIRGATWWWTATDFVPWHGPPPLDLG